MSDSAVERPVRAGFWRRAVAYVADASLIGVAVGLVALLLFGPSGEYIRVKGMVINKNECTQRDLKTLDGLDLRLPADFHPTHVFRCTSSVLGHVHDRTLIVAEVTRSGSVTYRRDYTFPVGADGRPMRAFYLDFLSFVVLFVYLLILQSKFGHTVGMGMFDISVRSLGGGRATWRQVARRLLILHIPIIIFLAAYPLDLFGINFISEPLLIIWLLGLSGVAALALAANIVWTVPRWQLPWHDRFAGTEVVLGT